MASLDDLRRAVDADPVDTEARRDLALARARVEGPDILLEPLRDREEWRACPELVQDLAIEEARRRLEPRGFRFKEARIWSCPNGELTVSHRLATFIYGETGWAMNLLPGDWPEALIPGNRTVVSPLGVRRTVINREEVPIRVEFYDGEAVIATVEVPPGKRVRVRLGKGHLKTAARARRLGPRSRPFLMARWPEAPFDEKDRSSAPIDEAAAIARRLAAWGLRFPSPEEWLFACRAGTSSRFYWGDEVDPSQAWFEENSGGSFQPPERHEATAAWNAFGLVDMVGNLWECTSAEFNLDRQVCGACFRTDRSGLELGAHLALTWSGIKAAWIGYRAAADLS